MTFYTLVALFKKEKEILPRGRKEKNESFYVLDNHYCVISKSKRVIIKHADEKVETLFIYEIQSVDNDNLDKIKLISI